MLSALSGLVKKTSLIHSFGYIEIYRGASKVFLAEPQAAQPRLTVPAIEENALTLSVTSVSQPPRQDDLRDERQHLMPSAGTRFPRTWAVARACGTRGTLSNITFQPWLCSDVSYISA